MKRIPDADIDRVRRAADLEQVVGEHVALRRGGAASLVGLCPFHDEKTPSFRVNRTSDGSFWHCFGCGEAGDVIKFVQLIQGASFPWAVQSLADRFNVALTYVEDDSDRVARDHRARLIAANEAAAEYFAAQMSGPEAAIARDFLVNRGFDPRTMIEQFGAGYAPRATNTLLLFLRERGFTVDEIVDAGLANRYPDRPARERFRSRLVWTIRDSFGKAIGFGARRLDDNDPVPGKFINTAETDVYRKSEVLWMQHVARKEITRTRRAFVVEGYTDVVAFHLAGYPETVATCGTAFTEDHLAALRRLVGPGGEIVFAFDDDKAGRKATVAVHELAHRQQRRLAALPAAGGLDPNDVWKAHGQAGITALVEKRTSLLERVLFSVVDGMPQKTPEDRAAALDAVLPLLEQASDPLVRAQHARQVAEHLTFDPELVVRRVERRARKRADQSSNEPSLVDVVTADRQRSVQIERDVLLALALSRDAAIAHIDKVERALASGQARRVHATLSRALTTEQVQVWPLQVLACAADSDRALIEGLLGLECPVPPERMVQYAGEMVAALESRAMRARQASLRRGLAQATDPAEKEMALAALLAARRTEVAR